MRNFLFLLHSYPDIDHIAPMIWKCLEKGDRIIVVFECPYAYKDDYRIQFLMRYPGFEILHLWGVESNSRWIRGISRIIWNYYTARALLRRYQISACFFEWGEGVIPKRKSHLLTELRRIIRENKIKRLTGVNKGLFQASPIKVVKAIFLRSLRIRLIMLARDLSIPMFALPHGVNPKLNIDYHPILIEQMNQSNGRLPFEDRNCFTAWVVPAEFHRRLLIDHGGVDPKIAQTWGSLRFCPQWLDILKNICPEASLPSKKDGQVRLVFFLPKWANRVDKEETVNLLKNLAKRGDIQLVLKTHPRKGTADLEDEYLNELLMHSNVSSAGNAHSLALIMDSDVIIDVGSGIVADALLQRKHLIYPAYLHKNKLIFDEYGGCMIARSSSDVHQFLDRIGRGQQRYVVETEIQSVIRELVYGGKDPFDVPEYYYTQVQSYLAR